MLRRSVLYLYRDLATSDERARLLRALSFIGLECPTVSAGDYGDDVAGGSRRLAEVPPWKRTPRFHAREEGPPSNYDVALHLDFADETALAAFEGHPARQRVEAFADGVTVGDLTARVDWRYEGHPPNRRGGYRHSAMFVWRDDADDASRAAALDAVRGLAGSAGVDSATVGESANGAASDFDWLLDLQLADEQAALAAIGGDAYTEAMKAVAGATKYEWTARVTHLMRG